MYLSVPARGMMVKVLGKQLLEAVGQGRCALLPGLEMTMLIIGQNLIFISDLN
jgi:hypothetical protein